MSMTREEAITQLDLLLEYCESMMTSEYPVWRRDCEALQMLIAALRPVSREQVEKVWMGCEKCNGAGEYSRYAENLTKILLAKYCPHCGRPLTDEAVDMVMEKINNMEEMTNEH